MAKPQFPTTEVRRLRAWEAGALARITGQNIHPPYDHEDARPYMAGYSADVRAGFLAADAVLFEAQHSPARVVYAFDGRTETIVWRSPVDFYVDGGEASYGSFWGAQQVALRSLFQLSPLQ